MTLQNTLDTIAPLGHTIIAVSAPPAAGADTIAWIDHLTSVSDSIEQRPAILVVPFSDIEAAEAFADQAPVKPATVSLPSAITVPQVKSLSLPRQWLLR